MSNFIQKLRRNFTAQTSREFELEMQFRQLVSNRHMSDFDYRHSTFSFKTVFYKSAYSYCCCPCAFDHEYMDYLNDDGTVTADLLESVVNNIIDGKCQHVTENMQEIYTKETRITALHVASAVATEKVIKTHIHQMYSGTGIFRLHPVALVVMKNCSKFFEILTSSHPGEFMHNHYSEIYLYATKSKQGLLKMDLQRVYLLELAAMKKNAKLVKNLLSSKRAIPAGLPQALKYAISNDLKDVQSVLMEYIQSIASSGKIVSALFCSEVAIVLDRSDILEKFIAAIPVKQVTGALNHWLLDTCRILKRNACRNILSKYDTSVDNKDRTTVDAQKYIKLLEMFYDDCKDEVIAALKDITDSPQECHKVLQGLPRLHCYLDPNKRLIDTRVLLTMFDLGLVDINSDDPHGRSTLTHFLENVRGYFMTYKNFVAILRTLIHENPATEDENVLEVALKIDYDRCQSSFRWCKFEFDMEGHYEMDQHIHSVFDADSDMVSNFVCPLLLDCGFQAKDYMLKEAILGGNFQDEELEYFQNYLDGFRPLMLRCRDVLRKHFVGRKLQGFLESQSLPQRIKDFVLIKV